MPLEDLLIIILISLGLGFALGFFTLKRRSLPLRTGIVQNWRSGSWKQPVKSEKIQ
jgi:hypothetical protein